jgi:hypothetical protein
MSTYSVFETLPASDSGKVPGSLSLHPSDDLSFGEDRESLVQPKMLKIFVRHQIARPAVGNLVGNHIGQTSITGLMNKTKTKN